MRDDVRALVAELDLTPHTEGGFYRETYRSARMVDTPRGARPALTSIVFLLASDAFSAFHRIASDEAWHFYRGDTISIEILAPDGSYERCELGAGGPWQTVVPAGAAFAAHVRSRDGYAIVGCDVAPGFDFADFELCERATLIASHPPHAALIERLTR